MFDLDFGISARHVDLVIPLFHVRGKIRKSKLSAKQNVEVLEERYEAERSEISLEKSSTTGLISNSL